MNGHSCAEPDIVCACDLYDVSDSDSEEGGCSCATSLTQDPIWNELQYYFTNRAPYFKILQFFLKNPSRLEEYSVKLDTPNDGQIIFDYSKNLVDDDVKMFLFMLARHRLLSWKRVFLLEGRKISFLDDQRMLHIAIRNRSNNPIWVRGVNIMEGVSEKLKWIREITDQVLDGQWRGYTGLQIKDVVVISSESLDLSIFMMMEALRFYASKVRIRLVSRQLGCNLEATLRSLSPETVLFLVITRNFSPPDNMTSILAARIWFESNVDIPAAVRKHFIALTNNPANAIQFGIKAGNILPLWNCVDRHFTLWSSLCLIISLYIGTSNFDLFLDGAHFIDNHFRDAQLEDNIPVIMGLLGVWYHNFYNIKHHVLFPFDQALECFCAYYQQGEIVTARHDNIAANEKPDFSVQWGKVGCRKSFRSVLQQGPEVITCDFILSSQSRNIDQMGPRYVERLCNFLNISETLMIGRTRDEAKEEAKENGLIGDKVEEFVSENTSKGNRPSNTFVINKVTPFTFGALLAIYEHKFMVQGMMWDVNPFRKFDSK